MLRKATLVCAVVLSASTFGAAAGRTENKTIWTGWFSDKGCAAAKVKSGNISPNGTACVKKCLDDGAAPVFISEQAKDIYDVKDHPRLADDVGYHIELTGVVDEKAKTVSVRSVKRLSEVVQMCALPRKAAKK
jgi:hypothetical protein